MLVVNEQLSIPLTEFDFTFARSGGPGGQNVNKVNTKATLRWALARSPSLPDDVRARFVARNRRRVTKEGDLVLTSQRYRDQGRNVGDCLAKLRELLLAAVPAPVARKTSKPTKAAKRRRLEDKGRLAEKKRLRGAPRGHE